MKKTTIAICALVLGLAGFFASERSVEAGPPGYYGTTYDDAWMYWYATQRPWHAPYYHTATGRPVSLVVPPTANVQSIYNWGVCGTELQPIYHQYARPFPSFANPSGRLRPTPYHPSSTDQFGVYYIRGPW